jgi:hypothetical protein
VRYSILSLVLDQSNDDMPVGPMPNLTRLTAILTAKAYSPHAVGIITRYVEQTGTLEGLEELGYLDPTDRPEADVILETSWPEELPTSPAWDADTVHGQPARWTVADGLSGVKLIPPELDDDFDHLPAA